MQLNLPVNMNPDAGLEKLGKKRNCGNF